MSRVDQAIRENPVIQQMVTDAASWNLLLDWYDRDVSDADIITIVSEKAHERRARQSSEAGGAMTCKDCGGTGKFFYAGVWWDCCRCAKSSEAGGCTESAVGDKQ